MTIARIETSGWEDKAIGTGRLLPECFLVVD
jgi:hypothetical protein